MNIKRLLCILTSLYTSTYICTYYVCTPYGCVPFNIYCTIKCLFQSSAQLHSTPLHSFPSATHTYTNTYIYMYVCVYIHRYNKVRKTKIHFLYRFMENTKGAIVRAQEGVAEWQTVLFGEAGCWVGRRRKLQGV